MIKICENNSKSWLLCIPYIFLVQVGLLFINLFKGISSLIANISKKSFKEEELDDSNEVEDF